MLLQSIFVINSFVKKNKSNWMYTESTFSIKIKKDELVHRFRIESINKFKQKFIFVVAESEPCNKKFLMTNEIGKRV